MVDHSVPARRRSRLAVLAGVAVAATVAVAWRLPAPAAAHETTVETHMDCTIGGALGVTYTVSHRPTVGAVAGQDFTIDLDTELSVNQPDPPVGLNGLTITVPSPPGLRWHGLGVDGDGTFDLDPQGIRFEAGNLVLAFKAKPDVTTATMKVPHLSFTTAIPADAAGQTFTFPTPSVMAFDLKLTPAPAVSTCTGGGTLLTTKATANPGGTVPPGTRPPYPDQTLLPPPVQPGSTTTTTAPGGGAPPAAPVSATPHYAG